MNEYGRCRLKMSDTKKVELTVGKKSAMLSYEFNLSEVQTNHTAAKIGL